MNKELTQFYIERPQHHFHTINLFSEPSKNGSWKFSSLQISMPLAIISMTWGKQAF